MPEDRFRRRTGEIVEGVGNRDLVWFGTRASDALPLNGLGYSRSIVSQIAPLLGKDAADFTQSSLETAIGQRSDLDQYDIDGDQDREAQQLKRQLVTAAERRRIVVAYRPAEFLSALEFCDANVVAAFNFHLFQRQLEHKPWTDSLLRRLDPTIPLLPTYCVRDTDIDQVGRMLDTGRLVGRTTRSASGSGVFLVKEKDDFIKRMPPHRDEFLTISPFLSDALPLNVNACVYPDGSVRLFGVSMQLIGIQKLTHRTFGFCGNDFAATSSLAVSDLRALEDASLRVGMCLARIGYRGVFGIDFLLAAAGLYVAEVNPRFQASTALCSQICQTLEIPDPCSEHLAAFLNLAPPSPMPMVEWTQLVGSLRGDTQVAQLFHRNTHNHRVRIIAASESFDNCWLDCLPDTSIWVDRHAMMFRSNYRQQITDDGYTLHTNLDHVLDKIPVVTSVLRP